MRRRKTRDVGDKRVDKKGMESKINCSRHLVVTGKVITCAAFSSPATYPCRIPFVVSQLFSRSYLLPLDTGHGEGSLEYGTNLAFDGEEPFDEGGGRITVATVGRNSLVVISPRTRFGLQQCVFLERVEDACLQRLRWERKMEKSTLSRYRTLFSILYFDSVVFRFFFYPRKKSSTEIYYY